ncbi:MAG TPA: agmatinase [Ktedonobacterales bacterium]|nr:agmatinase [Ktedonobacterales bacterium]
MSTPPLSPFETHHTSTQFGDPPPPWGELETAAAVVIPAPLEYTVCYGQGTGQGPAAIIAASTQMDLYDEMLDWTPMSAGIATLPALAYEGLAHEAALQRTEQAVADVLAMGKLPVTLGGEHSLTPACVRAVQQAADFAPLGLISFDAHADMRASYLGTPLSHACAMRRALEIPGVRALELGIRSISPEEVEDIRQEQPPLKIVWAHQIHDIPLDTLLEQLPERVYVTVDLDAFDPASMPAVGTPEPGGISWYEFLRFFKQIVDRKRVVGLDVVELAPIPGLSHPDFFAAKLVYRMLGLTFARLREATEAAPR